MESHSWLDPEDVVMVEPVDGAGNAVGQVTRPLSPLRAYNTRSSMRSNQSEATSSISPSRVASTVVPPSRRCPLPNLSTAHSAARTPISSSTPANEFERGEDGDDAVLWCADLPDDDDDDGGHMTVYIAPPREDSVYDRVDIGQTRCAICTEMLASLDSLNKHHEAHIDAYQKKSSGVRAYTCEVCDKDLQQRFNLLRHYLVHADVRPYECCVCFKRFREERNLRKHMPQHSSEKQFECDQCDKKYFSKQSLGHHQATKHKDVVKRFQCKYCHVAFAAPSDCSRHEISHTRAPQHQCGSCSLSFNRINQLTAHELEVHDVDSNARAIAADRPRRSARASGGSAATATPQCAAGVSSSVTAPSTGQADESAENLHTSSNEIGNEEGMDDGAESQVDTGDVVAVAAALATEGSETEQQHTAAVLNPLGTHPAMVEIGETPCSVCKQCFPSLESLSRHLETHINQCSWNAKQRGVFVCEVCFKEFPYRLQLIRHYLMHSDVRPYQCSFCEKRFREERTLNKHVVHHAKGKLHECPHCDRKYLSRDSLLYHISKHKNVVKRFQCKYCHVAFAAPSDCSRHEISHTRAPQHQCGSCSLSFNRINQLTAHKLEVHDVDSNARASGGSAATATTQCAAGVSTSVTAPSTGQADESAENLHTSSNEIGSEEAMDDGAESLVDTGDVVAVAAGLATEGSETEQQHTAAVLNPLGTHPAMVEIGETPCSVCKQCFPSLESLSRHLETHINQCSWNAKQRGVFVCEVCYKEFPYRLQLIRHYLMHSDVRPYQCSFCEKRFREERTLNKHVVHHAKGKLHECPHCDRKYLSRDSLLYHISKHKTPTLRHVCKLCGKAFRNPSDLSRHDQVHAKVAQHTCKICDMAFNKRSELVFHAVDVHKTSGEMKASFEPVVGHSGNSTTKVIVECVAATVSDSGDNNFSADNTASNSSSSSSNDNPADNCSASNSNSSAGERNTSDITATITTPATAATTSSSISDSGNTNISENMGSNTIPLLPSNSAVTTVTFSVLSPSPGSGVAVPSVDTIPVIASSSSQPEHASLEAINDNGSKSATAQVSDGDGDGDVSGSSGTTATDNAAKKSTRTSASRVCTECGKQFKSAQSLYNHRLSHDFIKAQQALAAKGIFPCAVCKQTFDSLEVLTRHLLDIHTGCPDSSETRSVYTCEVCSKDLKSKYVLLRHYLTHAGVRPFECSICHKRFTEGRNLNQHVLLHTQADLYECTMCNKKYSSKHSLLYHMTKHADKIMPYACQYCDKRFRAPSDVSRHELCHTKLKPHVCKICNKSFSKKCRLTLHEINEHMISGEMNTIAISHEPLLTAASHAATSNPTSETDKDMSAIEKEISAIDEDISAMEKDMSAMSDETSVVTSGPCAGGDDMSALEREMPFLDEEAAVVEEVSAMDSETLATAMGDGMPTVDADMLVVDTEMSAVDAEETSASVIDDETSVVIEGTPALDKETFAVDKEMTHADSAMDDETPVVVERTPVLDKETFKVDKEMTHAHSANVVDEIVMDSGRRLT